MAKIKLTKNELKSQKDALKMYHRYLPTLQLKKQQLQIEIRKTERQKREKEASRDGALSVLFDWVAVFGENVGLPEILQIGSMRREVGNIAGIDIPIFEKLDFEEQVYDLFLTPLWVDSALSSLRGILSLDAEILVLNEQIRLLGEELRVTTQRVNLFEKVKIPETREHIRKIQIYLGDQQTAAVVRGKIAKRKIVKVSVAS